MNLEAGKLTEKLNLYIKQNKQLDLSSHSIDGGDVGSTKDYNNKDTLTGSPENEIQLPSYLESERSSARTDNDLMNALKHNDKFQEGDDIENGLIEMS